MSDSLLRFKMTSNIRDTINNFKERKNASNDFNVDLIKELDKVLQDDYITLNILKKLEKQSRPDIIIDIKKLLSGSSLLFVNDNQKPKVKANQH